MKPFAETEADGYREQWITYGTGWYSAKELTVLPKRKVTIKDAAAYGLILTQGYGRFGTLNVSTPSMIRYGQMTEDELFVSEAAAREGVTHREPERDRSAGDPEALRAGQPGCGEVEDEKAVAQSSQLSGLAEHRGCGRAAEPERLELTD